MKSNGRIRSKEPITVVTIKCEIAKRTTKLHECIRYQYKKGMYIGGMMMVMDNKQCITRMCAASIVVM